MNIVKKSRQETLEEFLKRNLVLLPEETYATRYGLKYDDDGPEYRYEVSMSEVSVIRVVMLDFDRPPIPEGQVLRLGVSDGTHQDVYVTDAYGKKEYRGIYNRLFKLLKVFDEYHSQLSLTLNKVEEILTIPMNLDTRDMENIGEWNE